MFYVELYTDVNTSTWCIWLNLSVLVQVDKNQFVCFFFFLNIHKFQKIYYYMVGLNLDILYG